MPSSVGTFQMDFMNLKGQDRFDYITHMILHNSNYQIKNLLESINLNDTSEENMTRHDSIFWVCGQLMAYPDFVYVGLNR